MRKTLREIVQEREPENIGCRWLGGVYGCPPDYEYLGRKYENYVCNPCGCEGCWSQFYEEDEVEQTNYNKIEDIMMDLQLMTPLETIVEKIRADERAITELLLNLLVSFESDLICDELSTTEYCVENCNFDCPQKECYLKYAEQISEVG